MNYADTARTVLARWDDPQGGTAGWYVEAIDGDNQIVTDSTKVDFPLAVDDFVNTLFLHPNQNRTGLENALREVFPAAAVEIVR